MSKEEIAEQIREINVLPEEKQRYLYRECDKWCVENFEYGLEIAAIMESDNHENGITHSYLRNPEKNSAMMLEEKWVATKK